MKLIFCFICCFLFSLHASIRAQKQMVTLKLEKTSVAEAIRELKQQTRLDFFFSNKEVNVKKTVSLNCENMRIDEVLQQLLGTEFQFEFVDNMVIITPGFRKSEEETKSVLYKGTVCDSQGQPLPGVTVAVKGTSLGVATDVNGNFQIQMPPATNWIFVFSFIGMQTVEIQSGDRREFEVVLKPAKEELEEVVVTGYQTIRKERMTGTTATITANQIAGRGLQSIDEILNSTISGLNMISSGRPGQDAQIQIRGVNSLTGSTEPMWIVDGMPLQGEIPNIQSGSTDLQATIFTTGIGNIAPDDIKSITVLKDAAATAIYGARAANGVIVVETKSGLSGKTRFNASVNVGITERPRNNIDMMNTAEKIQFEREIFYDQQGYIYTPGRVTKLLQQAAYGEISSDEAERRIGELAKINTDWFKEIYRTAISQQYNFSMSGGNEKTQHYVSLNYLKEVGTEPNNKYDRLGMNIKLTHNPSEKIRITGGLGATMKNDRVTASSVNSLEYAMYANPYERLKNEDGTKAYDISYNAKESSIRDGLDWDTFNILDDLNRNTNTNRYLDAELSLKVEWEIVKGLMFTTHGVYNANSNHNRIIEGADTYTNFINNWYSYKGEIPHDMVKGSLR
ncbi:SusC/RagA family TonB-linked outer membrane protein, partial [Odoribacter splanchnicus]